MVSSSQIGPRTASGSFYSKQSTSNGVSVGGARGGVTFGPSGATVTSTNPITGKTTTRSYGRGGGGGGGSGTSTPAIDKVITTITQLEPINLKPEVKVEKTSETLSLGKIQEVNLNLGAFPKTQIMNRETTQNIQPTKSTTVMLLNEYSSQGYTPYQSKILEKTSGFKGLNYSKEKAMEVVVDYEKKHMPSSIYSLVSGEGTSGETMEQYKERMGKADIAWGKNVTYRELQKKGDYPTIVRKGFSDLGTKYFGFVSDITTNISKKPKLSEERKKEGGRVLGETALWGFFSPFMKTGSYGESFEEFGQSIKKKKKTQQLSTNRFSDLGTGLDINIKEKAIGKIERDLLNLKTLAEQKKYLANLYKISVKNPEQEAGFKILLNELNAKNIIKIPIIDIGKGGTIITQPQITKFSFIYDTKNIPQMKNIWGITGFSTKNYGLSNINKVNQKEDYLTKGTQQKSFTDVMLAPAIKVLVKKKSGYTTGITRQKNFIDVTQIFNQPQQQLPKQIPKQIPRYNIPQPLPYIPQKPLPIPYFKPFIWIPKKPKTSWSWTWPTRSTKGKPGKRAYQSSLGAYQLGIFARKKYPKVKQQTGLSIRPIVYNKESSNSYSKRINKLLIGGY